MPRKNKYQTKRDQEKIKKAERLYKEGLSLREVGFAVGRSHEWVRKQVQDLTKNDK